MNDPTIPFGETLNPERGFTHMVYQKPACRKCGKPFSTHVPNQKQCHDCRTEQDRQRILRSRI